MSQINQISINKIPAFQENWHEGYVEHEGLKHQFWLLHPIRQVEEDNDYELEVRWFFKNVPREVRMLYPQIIESFKQTL